MDRLSTLSSFASDRGIFRKLWDSRGPGWPPVKEPSQNLKELSEPPEMLVGLVIIIRN
jgi:hypothetical protein